MALSGGWIFLILVIVVALLAFAGWTLYARIRAQRLGLPPPSLNPFAKRSDGPAFPAPRAGGLIGWVNDKIRALKNRRYASGAGYEEGRTNGATGGFRNAGSRLDPDEAWDARVGNEAYYEEQELGLHSTNAAPTAYGGSGYGVPTNAAPYESQTQDRGRSRTREVANPYDNDRSRSRNTAQNPFGDAAEPSNISLRGVSPRPLDTGSANKQGGKSNENSPTERRSMFRENM